MQALRELNQLKQELMLQSQHYEKSINEYNPGATPIRHPSSTHKECVPEMRARMWLRMTVFVAVTEHACAGVCRGCHRGRLHRAA